MKVFPRNFFCLVILLFPLSLVSQKVAIQRGKMNIFYKGIDNPIRVVVENYPCDKIEVKVNSGRIKLSSDSCYFIYVTDSCTSHKETVTIGIKESDSVRWIDTMDFRLNKIPDPVTYIAQRTGAATVSRAQLCAATRLFSRIENLDIDWVVEVTNYSVRIKRGDEMIYSEENIEGYRITDSCRAEFNKLIKGDKVYIEDIKAKYDSSLCWEMSPISLTIE